MHGRETYQLLDVGGGARLERFGERVVDRPHPAALGSRGDPGAWQHADLRFDRDRGWTGEPSAREPWSVSLGGITMELRPTEAGQLGLFPEHAAMLPWLIDRARASAAQEDQVALRPSVLHLFAYTGLATLTLAAADVAVTHVDASRPTIAWARENAARSGLDDRPVRWIVDDATAFIYRELRRKRQYDGLILDPPSYGHGPDGQAWRLDRDLGALLAASARMIPATGFVLLTAHSPGFDGKRLASELASALSTSQRKVQHGDLTVATDDGHKLELGAFARWSGAAS